MTMQSDDVLKLSLAAAALAGGLSVAYHYAVYLPGRDLEIDARQQLANLEKNNAAATQKAAEEKRQHAKNAAYRICLSSAYGAYDARWQASCKDQADEAEISRQRCINSGINTNWCSNQYPIPPRTNCSLPGSLADDYDANHQRARQQCLDEAKAEVASFDN